MATPRTKEQIALCSQALVDWSDTFHEVFSRRLFDLIVERHVWLQRPHTGDMMQMCVDLGIDVPDFQPVSYDGKEFRITLRKDREPRHDAVTFQLGDLRYDL